MSNSGDYQRDLDHFFAEQNRLAQDADFQGKIDRLAGFMKCNRDEVLQILRREGQVPLGALLRFGPVPTGDTDIERVESAIALMDSLT